MGYQYLIPEFCPTCKQLRSDDPTFEYPKKMGETDVVCYRLAYMCTECFKHINGRAFGSITEEYEKNRHEFLEQEQTNIQGQS
jgi:hypothetical protein